MWVRFGSGDLKTLRKRWASMDNTVHSKTVSVFLFTIFTIFLHYLRISSYVTYPPHHYFESSDFNLTNWKPESTCAWRRNSNMADHGESGIFQFDIPVSTGEPLSWRKLPALTGRTLLMCLCMKSSQTSKPKEVVAALKKPVFVHRACHRCARKGYIPFYQSDRVWMVKVPSPSGNYAMRKLDDSGQACAYTIEEYGKTC